MPDPTNGQIADAFEELASLYELDGASVHRVIAYRTAAKVVRESSRSIAALYRAGSVTRLGGIGATLEQKIGALVEGGSIPAIEKLRARYPPGVLEVMRLPSFGAKKARRLFDELGVDSPAALRVAARAGRIRELNGFGEKIEARALELLERDEPAATPRRTVLSRAERIGLEFVEALSGHPAAEKVTLSGSVRRAADSVRDLDLVATATEPLELAKAMASLELVESHGTPTAAGVRARTHSGLSVDLKIVAPEQYGNVLQHFTGSKAHNVGLREAAVRRGLHVSEYGILDDATGERRSCATESEVYAALGLPWIPPELREGRGELEAAAAGELPQLIELADLRGDMHCHTVASDGRNTIQEMAEAARDGGLEYLAITDHSASHGFGQELSPDALRAHIARVREANMQVEGIELLAGSEVNILPDGRPDYEDELLAELDWAIGSVHTAFGLSEDAMTARIVAAIEHPLLDAIGHPTGRKIERRAPYALDIERVIEAAARTGTMLEINAAPDRRDLSDIHARAAAAAGVRILIDSDAHGVETLGLIRFGIATARRAWLSAGQVANTLAWSEFAPLRKRARS